MMKTQWDDSPPTLTPAPSCHIKPGGGSQITLLSTQNVAILPSFSFLLMHPHPHLASETTRAPQPTEHLVMVTFSTIAPGFSTLSVMPFPPGLHPILLQPSKPGLGPGSSKSLASLPQPPPPALVLNPYTGRFPFLQSQNPHPNYSAHVGIFLYTSIRFLGVFYQINSPPRR